MSLFFLATTYKKIKQTAAEALYGDINNLELHVSSARYLQATIWHLF